MDAVRTRLSSSSALQPATRKHHSKLRLPSLSSPSKVPEAHDQSAHVAISLQTTSISRNFPASVLCPEQRDDFRTSFSILGGKKFQKLLHMTPMVDAILSYEEKESDRYLKEFEQWLLYWPSLWHFSGPRELEVELPKNEVATIRSRRLLERQSMKRKIPKIPKVEMGVPSSRLKEKNKNVSQKDFDPNDPLRLFLRGPETKRLLTAKEELDLCVQIQDLRKLEEVKLKLQSQFQREPTLVEWAKALGMNSRDLKSCLHLGNRSRQKMINANSRLVVHVAKQYLSRGLSFQDLLQEGSMGLMKSLEKFKPRIGCRFSAYAYWWIRQSIRKALVLKSRIIRLPENVYTVLAQITNARRSYIQAGHHPTNEELASRVGIKVEKLEMLLASAQKPISLQQTVWHDQEATFQEITADPGIEIPEMVTTKQLMRRHVRNLLFDLSPRERQIIQLRYGIHDGKRKTLSDIGTVFGITKEGVRQVEIRALDKLKQCVTSEGLEAYKGLLT